MFQAINKQASDGRDPDGKTGRRQIWPVRLERCLKMTQLIGSELDYNTDQLAVELGVSRRQIFRDLALLRMSGFAVEFNADHDGYVLLNCKASTGLSKEDIRSIAMFLILPAELWELLGESLERNILVGRLLAMLRSSESEHLAKIRAAFKSSVEQTRRHPAPDVVPIVFEGIGKNLAVRVVCESSDGKATIKTKVAPQRLVQVDGEWGVLGRSSFHRRTCFFRFSSIQRAEITEDAFRRATYIVVPPARWRF